MTRLLTTVAGAMLFCAGCTAPRPVERPVQSDKFAALFAGDGGIAFSSGLNQWASDLKGMGYETRIFEATQWQAAVEDARRGKRVRLCGVGHSFGGRACIDWGAALANYGIAVDTLVLLDGSQPSTAGGNFLTARAIAAPISANVRRAQIWCIQSTPILSQWPCPRISWTPATIVETPAVPPGVNHLNITSDPAIRSAAMAMMGGKQ